MLEACSRLTAYSVKEILPELLSHIIVLISGSEFEQQEVFAHQEDPWVFNQLIIADS